MLGVASPLDAINWQSSGGTEEVDIPLCEDPNSPQIERAEQATITHTFGLSYQEAMDWLAVLHRGTIHAETGPDGWVRYYMVLSASVQRKPGRMASLTVVTESKSFDSPPDEFSCVPVELGVDIVKHPRYFYAFVGNASMPGTLASGDSVGGLGSKTEILNQMVIRLYQDYKDNSSANYRDAIIQMLNYSLGDETGSGTSQPPAWNKSTEAYPTDAFVAGTDMAKRAMMEIVQKYWRGEETPYLVGYEVTWSQYFFRPPFLNPGGYIEDPISEGGLPDYFWSTGWPDVGNDIFFGFDVYNPQSYSVDGTLGGGVNISWLRKADQIDYQRTWFKVTRTWVGSAVGFWDVDLYNQGSRPQNSGAFREIKTA